MVEKHANPARRRSGSNVSNCNSRGAARVKPPTLVSAGGADFPWIRESAQALAELIPGAKTHFLDGQRHNVDPAALAPVMVEFFTS